MKTILFLKALLIGLFIFSAGDVKAQQAAAGTAGGYCGCTACNCWHGYGNCAWCVTDLVYSGATNEMPVSISIANQTTIVISYLQAVGESHEDNLTLSDNVSLPQSICTKLGVKSVTINKGSYLVDYSQNPNGDITCSAVIQ